MRLTINIHLQTQILQDNGSYHNYRVLAKYESLYDINPNNMGANATFDETIFDEKPLFLNTPYGEGEQSEWCWKENFIFRKWSYALWGVSITSFVNNWTNYIVPLIPGQQVITQLNNQPFVEFNIFDNNTGEINICFKATGLKDGKGAYINDVILRDATVIRGDKPYDDIKIGEESYQWTGRGLDTKHEPTNYEASAEHLSIQNNHIITNFDWTLKPTDDIKIKGPGTNAIVDTDIERKYKESPLTINWNTTAGYSEANSTGQFWGLYKLNQPLNNPMLTEEQRRGTLILNYKENKSGGWTRDREKIIQIKEFDENNNPLNTDIKVGILKYKEKWNGETLTGYEVINFQYFPNDVVSDVLWKNGQYLYFSLKNGYSLTNGQTNIVLLTESSLLGPTSNPNRDTVSFFQVKISKTTFIEKLDFIIQEKNNGVLTGKTIAFNTTRESYYIGTKFDSSSNFSAYTFVNLRPTLEWEKLIQQYINFNLINHKEITQDYSTSIKSMLSLPIIHPNRIGIGDINITPSFNFNANNFFNVTNRTFDIVITLDTKTEVINRNGGISLKHISPDTDKFPTQITKSIGSYTAKEHWTGITEEPQSISDFVVSLDSGGTIVNSISIPNWITTQPLNPSVLYKPGYNAPSTGPNFEYGGITKAITINYSEQYQKTPETFTVKITQGDTINFNIYTITRYKYTLYNKVEYSQFIEHKILITSWGNLRDIFITPEDGSILETFIASSFTQQVNEETGTINANVSKLKPHYSLLSKNIDYNNKIITFNFDFVKNQATQNVKIIFTTQVKDDLNSEPLESFVFAREIYDKGEDNNLQHFKSPWNRTSSTVQTSAIQDISKLTLTDVFDNYQPIVVYKSGVSQKSITTISDAQYTKVFKIIVDEILPSPQTITKGIYASIDNQTIYLGNVVKNYNPDGIFTPGTYDVNWVPNLILHTEITQITSINFKGPRDEVQVESVTLKEHYQTGVFTPYSGDGTHPSGYILPITVETSQHKEIYNIYYKINEEPNISAGQITRFYSTDENKEMIYTNWDYTNYKSDLMALDLKEFVSFSVNTATIPLVGEYAFTLRGYEKDLSNTDVNQNIYTYIFKFTRTSVAQIDLINKEVVSGDTNLLEEEVDKAFDDIDTTKDLINQHSTLHDTIENNIPGLPYPKLPEQFELAIEGEHFQIVCASQGQGATSTLVNGIDTIDTNTTGVLSYDLMRTNEVISVEDITAVSSIENPLSDPYFNRAKIPSQEYEVSFRIMSECGKAHTIRDKIIESVATIWEQFDKQQFILNRLISPKYFECDYLSWGKLYIGKKKRFFKTLDGKYLPQTSKSEIDRYIQVVPTKIKRNLSQEDNSFNTTFSITFFAPVNIATSEPITISLDQAQECIIDNPKTLFNAYANLEVLLQVKDKNKAKRNPNPHIRFDFLDNNGEIMKRHAIYYKNLGEIKKFQNDYKYNEGSITTYLSDTFGFKNVLNDTDNKQFKGVMWQQTWDDGTDVGTAGLNIAPDWFISSITGFEDGVLEFPYQNDYNYLWGQDLPNPNNLNEDYRILSNHFGSLMECKKLKISILDNTKIEPGTYDISIRLLPKSII